MWNLNLSWSELIARASIVYGTIFLLFRLMGKKQLGEMSPFDFVLLLIVSESVSNALSGGENSVAGGLISAVTLLTLSGLMDRIAFRNKKVEEFLEGTPQFVVLDGKICQDIMKKEKITENELMEAIRQHDVDDVRQLKYAILETNGKISVIKKS